MLCLEWMLGPSIMQSFIGTRTKLLTAAVGGFLIQLLLMREREKERYRQREVGVPGLIAQSLWLRALQEVKVISLIFAKTSSGEISQHL